MSETPIFDELAKKYGFSEKLTDSQIEGRDEVSPEATIDLHEENTVDPAIFGIEKDHEVLQPPTYEAPSHLEQLRRTIELSPELVLVKDIKDVGVAQGTVRRSQIAA